MAEATAPLLQQDGHPSSNGSASSSSNIPTNGKLSTSHELSRPTSASCSSEAKVKVPWTVGCIIGNEFCERFSFYGLRAILALYLTQQLHLSEEAATESVHLFIVAAYLTPLFGAFIADSYLGKYLTIMYLSLIYCTGNWVVAYSATLDSESRWTFYWAAGGLALQSLGSGGIKPCVSAFGGDQVEMSNPPGPARDAIVRKFFSWFYFSINVGSTFSTIVTPWLREHRGFAPAFAAPAVLMMLATLIFWLGSRGYQHQPPGGNIVAEVVQIMWTATKLGLRQGRGGSRGSAAGSAAAAAAGSGLGAGGSRSKGLGGGSSSNLLTSVAEGRTAAGLGVVDAAGSVAPQQQLQRKLSHRGSKRAILPPGASVKPHWLDPAKGVYGEERVEDVKQLLRVLLLFLPVPIFWSLFDQQASKWVFQATKMDGRIPNGSSDPWITVLPDQMQTVNSVLILVMIPFFDGVIYPLAERSGISLRPIRRMVVGMIFGAAAFLISGILQLWMDSYAAKHNPPSLYASAWGQQHGAFASIMSHSNTTTSSSISGALAGGAARILEAVPAAPLSAPAPSPTCNNELHCVSLMWQVPQYVVMTAGEILFSITGLEMAYSQAPSSMSSVVTAGWSGTVAAGNLVTVVVVAVLSRFNVSASSEFFIFAALCLMSMFLLRLAGRGFAYMQSCSDLEALESAASAASMEPGLGVVPGAVSVPQAGARQQGVAEGGGVGSPQLPV